MDITEKPERLWVHYFKKGKARVLLSGLVVGDSGTWKAVKSNRFASLGEDTTDKVTTDASTSSANVPSPVITINVHELKKTGEIQKKNQLRIGSTKSLTKHQLIKPRDQISKKFLQMTDNNNEKQITVDKDAKEETNAHVVKIATIGNYQSIEHQSAEDNGGIENDCP
ncbi:hypothetical protein KY285_010945 [Solanum tuberosum]|nr:hypothetical protein KY289_011513 [Solanum tuberosum]KAH0735238.1 hypothetical protein KY285_010945 [Solanum tuberosum]